MGFELKKPEHVHGAGCGHTTAANEKKVEPKNLASTQTVPSSPVKNAALSQQKANDLKHVCGGNCSHTTKNQDQAPAHKTITPHTATSKANTNSESKAPTVSVPLQIKNLDEAPSQLQKASHGLSHVCGGGCSHKPQTIVKNANSLETMRALLTKKPESLANGEKLANVTIAQTESHVVMPSDRTTMGTSTNISLKNSIGTQGQLHSTANNSSLKNSSLMPTAPSSTSAPNVATKPIATSQAPQSNVMGRATTHNNALKPLTPSNHTTSHVTQSLSPVLHSLSVVSNKNLVHQNPAQTRQSMSAASNQSMAAGITPKNNMANLGNSQSLSAQGFKSSQVLPQQTKMATGTSRTVQNFLGVKNQNSAGRFFNPLSQTQVKVPLSFSDSSGTTIQKNLAQKISRSTDQMIETKKSVLASNASINNQLAQIDNELSEIKSTIYFMGLLPNSLSISNKSKIFSIWGDAVAAMFAGRLVLAEQKSELAERLRKLKKLREKYLKLMGLKEDSSDIDHLIESIISSNYSFNDYIHAS